MNSTNFFTELKRRKVFKVGAAYLVVAWLAVQAASIGFPAPAYYFANLYSSKPAGHAMLRDPRVKAMVVRYGFPAYWREKGWPAGCRPLGETDFECGAEAAPAIEMSLFAELKRRNLFRAAAFYAASAWLVVQIATQVFPFFHIAEWVVRWIVVAAAIGFPFAMMFSWFYEWTPHGLERESEVAPNESITPQTGRKLDRWIIAILGMAVALLLANQFVRHRDEEPTDPRPGAVPQKSIAVLPFENLSDDKSNAYFADGIQDQILTKLAGVADLKVISRISAAKYKSKPENLKTVSQELGVATVLEGTVQRAGARVRINVQLVDARADTHLWAKNYDRELKDVFGVQSEVAQQIADALRAKLSPSEATALAVAPTRDPEAYDLFLQGEYEMRQGESALTSPEPFDRAAKFYREALESRPELRARSRAPRPQPPRASLVCSSIRRRGAGGGEEER